MRLLNVGSSEFDVFEVADPWRLEEWRKFADGESDEIYGDNDGDCWYIKVRDDIAVAYCQCGDFSIRQEVDPAAVRAEIRRHLERFRDGSF
jgi:hypothetical protein